MAVKREEDLLLLEEEEEGEAQAQTGCEAMPARGEPAVGGRRRPAAVLLGGDAGAE